MTRSLTHVVAEIRFPPGVQPRAVGALPVLCTCGDTVSVDNFSLHRRARGAGDSSSKVFADPDSTAYSSWSLHRRRKGHLTKQVR